MQILVVDDSRTMRMLVTRTLRQAGFGGHDIVEAGDGLEALDVIRSVGADIVLCDWNMPRMSGLELLQTLRGHGDKRPFPHLNSLRLLHRWRTRLPLARKRFKLPRPNRTKRTRGSAKSLCISLNRLRQIRSLRS